MHPLIQLMRDIAVRVPMGILPVSISGILFWLVTLLVWMQYRRLSRMEKKIHGFVINDPLRSTATAAVYGVAAGVVGSMILLFTGVVLFPPDVMYLWPVALALMLINPRFLCFSYAAGLLVMAHLILGWPPEINAPGILALVAILHLMEGILVLFSGDTVSTPVYFRRPDRSVAGGYLIQRFWPIPLLIIFLLQVPPEYLSQATQMPDWWPLIETPVPGGDWARVLTSVVAALGYSDLAVTEMPRRRARQSAQHLWIFSAVLLVLSWGITRMRSLIWVAALFSALGHEAMIKYGSRQQLRGRPRFKAHHQGVVVMEAGPAGFGRTLGLKRGDVILAVDGEPVLTRAELSTTVADAGGDVTVTVYRDGRELRLRGGPRGADLRIVTAPEPGDRAHVNLGTVGFAGRMWRWLLRRFTPR